MSVDPDCYNDSTFYNKINNCSSTVSYDKLKKVYDFEADTTYPDLETPYFDARGPKYNPNSYSKPKIITYTNLDSSLK